MITIKEARSLVASQAIELRREVIPVEQACDRVLALSIASSLDLPFFDNSAMDGYAVNGEQEQYTVIGEVAAGQASGVSIGKGEAMRIFTGAKIPEGTTAVVIQEVVDVSGREILVKAPIKTGANIRRKGDELKKGALVFEKGQKLNPAGIGLLLSLGITEVEVYAWPSVGILVTGSELVSSGKELTSGEIYESNSGMLQAALCQLGISEVTIQKVPDGLEATKQMIAQLLSGVDVLLISGGISVGDYDFVKESLDYLGVEGVFYKVAQKPGKPLFFGRQNAKFVFALPGNPASSLNCYYVYVQALLLRMMGKEHPNPVRSILAHDQVVKGTRPTFFRSSETDGKVSIKGGQSSSMLHAFALGNALALLEPGDSKSGVEVLVWRF